MIHSTVFGEFNQSPSSVKYNVMSDLSFSILGGFCSPKSICHRLLGNVGGNLLSMQTMPAQEVSAVRDAAVHRDSPYHMVRYDHEEADHC